MSNYKVGDMVRMTRLAEGISQEELCDNICSVQTLSRIENGKVAVKRKIYKQLMQRMGRDGNKAYSCLQISDFELIDIMRVADNLIFRREYEEAKEYLEKIKEDVKKSEIASIQYIKKMESIIEYGVGKCSAKEHLERLEATLELTISNYKEYLTVTYPFTIEEIRLLMNISTMYGELDDERQGIMINYMLIRSLNTGYMNRKHSIPLLINIIHGTARLYGGLKEYQIAIQMSRNAIEKAKKNYICSVLPTAYSEMAWNMMKQINNNQRDKADLLVCKRYLRQAYAAAALSKQYMIGEVIKRVYQEFFEEEDIYSLGSGANGDSSPNS